MSNKTFYKDPQAVLDYTIDWADWLETDLISTSTWTVPSGLTEGTHTNTTTTTTAWISGGTEGVVYEITNHIVTAAGREDDRSFNVKIQDK